MKNKSVLQPSRVSELIADASEFVNELLRLHPLYELPGFSRRSRREDVGLSRKIK